MNRSTIAEMEISAGAGAPRAARRFVAGVLADWSVADDTSERSQLLVSELVSNAVLHGTGPVRIRMIRIGSVAAELRIEVSNDGEGAPVMRQAATTDLSGRGLQLVSELSAGWGSDSSNGQTKVWFELV